MRLLCLAVLLLTLGATLGASAPAPVVIPATLEDVHGEVVDVGALASRSRLVVITLKAAWCPVCREQLVRLRREVPRLESCGATFVVLAPGPRDALRGVADATGFPYPFVADEGLALARAADLVLAADQMVPAVFGLNERREIVWMERGRSGAMFSDEALFEHLACPPGQRARRDMSASEEYQ